MPPSTCAVWIGHLRDKQAEHLFKLPATQLLGADVDALPEVEPGAAGGYRDIWYEEADDVGYPALRFLQRCDGYGAVRTPARAYRAACSRETRVLVLMGGPDYWSNGMHLNRIEAADGPADESWRNINAIDDLAREIIETDSHLTVAALRGMPGPVACSWHVPPTRCGHATGDPESALQGHG